MEYWSRRAMDFLMSGRTNFLPGVGTARGRGGERCRGAAERLSLVMSVRGKARSACAARRLQARLAVLALILGLCGWQYPFRVPAADFPNLPPVSPPPDMFSGRSPLPDLLLKDKRTGRYVTGFPAIGWDPESQFNYGVGVQWYDNGPAARPFFR